jgi:SAM-dependent methyltransferase
MTKSLEDILTVNREQASFYDAVQEAEETRAAAGYEHNKQANVLTRFWASLRYRQQASVRSAGIEARVREHHVAWMNKKRGGDFLEIGCFSGSPYTFELVDASRSYLGIELSTKAVASLNAQMASKNLSGKAEAKAIDFLTMPEESRFDLVYAHGVLHHFENPALLFSKLHRLMKPGAVLLFVDPVAINPIYRWIRRAYRPFQSDAAWEWPFSTHTVRELEKYFTIESGFGWGQFSLPLSVATGLPIIGSIANRAYLAQVKREVSKGWHPRVWLNSMVAGACKLKSEL